MRGEESAAKMSHDTMTNSVLLKDIGVSLIGISASSFVLKTFFYFLSGSLSLMLSLAEFIWFWNGFQQPPTQRIWIRSVIQDKSSTSALDEWTLARLIIDSLLCVQVLQFYSRQSYQNKAVPSAGLLFVFIEQANGLPVSILSSMNTVMSGAVNVFTGTCYC